MKIRVKWILSSFMSLKSHKGNRNACPEGVRGGGWGVEEAGEYRPVDFPGVCDAERTPDGDRKFLGYFALSYRSIDPRRVLRPLDPHFELVICITRGCTQPIEIRKTFNIFIQCSSNCVSLSFIG